MTEKPETTPATDQAAELDRLRTQNERMRHELEVMYGGAFDSLPAPAPGPGLRDQVAAALHDHFAAPGMRDTWRGVKADYLRAATAVLAVPAIRDTQAELQQLREQVARVREWLPVLRRAVDSLPAVCRYHGDQLDPDRFARMTRSEACCDTGVPARRRREAVKALEALDPKEPS